MSKVQRWVLIGGLLACFLAGLFPPVTWVGPGGVDWRGGPSLRENVYVHCGRTFLLWPRGWTKMKLGKEGTFSGSVRIDYWRLGLEWLTIAAATGAVFLFAHRWRGRPA